jgi:hypothetical protein
MRKRKPPAALSPAPGLDGFGDGRRVQMGKAGRGGLLGRFTGFQCFHARQMCLCAVVQDGADLQDG